MVGGSSPSWLLDSRSVTKPRSLTNLNLEILLGWHLVEMVGNKNFWEKLAPVNDELLGVFFCFLKRARFSRSIFQVKKVSGKWASGHQASGIFDISSQNSQQKHTKTSKPLTRPYEETLNPIPSPWSRRKAIHWTSFSSHRSGADKVEGVLPTGKRWILRSKKFKGHSPNSFSYRGSYFKYRGAIWGLCRHFFFWMIFLELTYSWNEYPPENLTYLPLKVLLSRWFSHLPKVGDATFLEVKCVEYTPWNEHSPWKYAFPKGNDRIPTIYFQVL